MAARENGPLGVRTGRQRVGPVRPRTVPAARLEALSNNCGHVMTNGPPPASRDGLITRSLRLARHGNLRECLKRDRPSRWARSGHEARSVTLKRALTCDGAGGRYWVRTSDLLGVNEALYH